MPAQLVPLSAWLHCFRCWFLLICSIEITLKKLRTAICQSYPDQNLQQKLLQNFLPGFDFPVMFTNVFLIAYSNRRCVLSITFTAILLLVMFCSNLPHRYKHHYTSLNVMNYKSIGFHYRLPPIQHLIV